jgi:hypothetical protein
LGTPVCRRATILGLAGKWYDQHCRPGDGWVHEVKFDGYRAQAHMFFFHSGWVDEAAFDLHSGLPHTVRFLDRVQPLIDHPLDVARTMPLNLQAGSP